MTNDADSGESSAAKLDTVIAEAWNWVMSAREYAGRIRATGQPETADALTSYVDAAAHVLLKHGYGPPGDWETAVTRVAL